MRRPQSARDIQKCGKSYAWREFWQRQAGVVKVGNGDSDDYVVEKIVTEIVPCEGCYRDKRKLNQIIPGLGDIFSFFANRVGGLFGVTSNHPVAGKWSVVVTTCPLLKSRESDEIVGQRDTLLYCLNSLIVAGWTKKQISIFAEPGSSVPLGFHTIRREKRYRLLPNLVDGIKYAIERDDPDCVLIVEDDMIFAPNLLNWLLENPWPGDAHMINLFKMDYTAIDDKKIHSDELLEESMVENY